MHLLLSQSLQFGGDVHVVSLHLHLDESQLLQFDGLFEQMHPQVFVSHFLPFGQVVFLQPPLGTHLHFPPQETCRSPVLQVVVQVLGRHEQMPSCDIVCT